MCKREMESAMVPISEIHVAERVRRENGDIGALARSIQERGLLNPITVMRQSEGGYLLVAGLRRLEAMRSLGAEEIRVSVASPMEADELLMMEFDENEQRKEFTHSERLAHAARLKAVVEEQSRQRKGNRTPRKEHKVGHGLPYASDNVAGEVETMTQSNDEKGKSVDIIAKKVGYGSGRQMKRVEEIAEKRPDLMDAIDQKTMSVRHAHDIVTGKADKAAPKKRSGFIAEETVEVEMYQSYKPFLEPAPGSVDSLAGADHEHLMQNPIYKKLFQSYEDAVQQVNLSRSELRSRCEGYERRIRGYKENIQAMEVEIKTLREMRHAGA